MIELIIDGIYKVCHNRKGEFIVQVTKDEGESLQMRKSLCTFEPVK